MYNVFEVAQVLIDNAVRTHGDAIDLICYYGSQARGDARPASDLDIFYVPAEGEAPPVGHTFLLEGRLFDFWAIRWETLEGFATGRLRGWAFAPALVDQAQVLYARSAAQTERLLRLQARIHALQSPAARPQMIRRALGTFASVQACLARLRHAAAEENLTGAQYAAWQVIAAVWESLALANQVVFERGLAKSLREAERFDHRPVQLASLIATLATASAPAELLAAGEQLVTETRRVLRDLQDELAAPVPVREQFREAYPEIKDAVRKVLTACERGDPVVAGAEAWQLQAEVVHMLARTAMGWGHGDFNRYGELAAAYRNLDLPDLIEAAAAEDLDELHARTRRFDAVLRRFLTEHGVELGEFASLAALKQALAPGAPEERSAGPGEEARGLSSVVVKEPRLGQGAVCEPILRVLPDWFGIEEATQQYVRDIDALPTLLALLEDEVVGFLTLKQQTPYAWEIHVMGVRPAAHRRGVGRALLERAEVYLRAQGADYLQVKTLSAAHSDEGYARTRRFYRAVGFRPLQEFPTFWGEENPCLQMIKVLERSYVTTDY